jgi:hypothetical protein
MTGVWFPRIINTGGKLPVKKSNHDKYKPAVVVNLLGTVIVLLREIIIR